MDTLICAAAGLSSRMGAHKPLMPLGDQSIIRTLIGRYRSCGVNQVVLVTGHNADALEEHVRDLGVLCRRNERYAESDMLESIKIGIRTYLEEGASPSDGDRILFTPCDIPLVSETTITTLLASDSDLCAPTMDGKRGHPLRLPRRILDQILSYEGDCGLKGALDALGLAIATIPVDDPGILLDADTPEDYERLKELFQARYA